VTGETFAAMLTRLRSSQPGYSQGNRFASAQQILSQSALARMAGIDPAYVHRLERGGKSPSRTVVLALAEVLDISQSETDRFLVAAGLAPQGDWQTRAEAAEAKLDMIQQIFDVPTDLLLFRKRVG
jgi:transcriptional regulator with XRE-family HTH domain